MAKNMWLRLFLRYKHTGVVTKMYILWRKSLFFDQCQTFRVIKMQVLGTNNFIIQSTKQCIYTNKLNHREKSIRIKEK